jgi:hypothetical protein
MVKNWLPDGKLLASGWVILVRKCIWKNWEEEIKQLVF